MQKFTLVNCDKTNYEPIKQLRQTSSQNKNYCLIWIFMHFCKAL